MKILLTFILSHVVSNLYRVIYSVEHKIIDLKMSFCLFFSPYNRSHLGHSVVLGLIDSVYGQKQLKNYSKHLLLCSSKERNLKMFGSAWELNNDTIFILCYVGNPLPDLVFSLILLYYTSISQQVLSTCFLSVRFCIYFWNWLIIGIIELMHPTFWVNNAKITHK